MQRDNTRSLHLRCLSHMTDAYLVLWLENNEMTGHYQPVMAAFQQGEYPVVYG